MSNDKTTLHDRFESVTVQGHLTTAIEHGKKWIEDYSDKTLTIFLRSAKQYDLCVEFKIIDGRLIYQTLDIEGYVFEPLLADKVALIKLSNELYSSELDEIAAANEPPQDYDTMESLGFSNSDFLYGN